MGILPIGFFSPLPLAMMIPFMATQSLAMGEAFGKSFQYGKRKISSMTNEEFNRYTFQDMMNEQTANIKMIIPKLHEQMEDSRRMQDDIFAEMIKLIPTFVESVLKELGKAITPTDQTGGNTLPDGTVIPIPGITMAGGDQHQSTIVNVSHSGGDSTLVGDAGGGNPMDPQDQRVLNFRKMIKNWNKEWTKSALARPQNYQQWQIQELEAHLQSIIKFEGGDDIIPPEQDPLTPMEIAQKAYLSTTIAMQKDIIAKRDQLQALIDRRIGNSPSGKKRLQVERARLDRLRKKLQNYISLARNNPLTKSVANRDWNDRIWKI